MCQRAFKSVSKWPRNRCYWMQGRHIKHSYMKTCKKNSRNWNNHYSQTKILSNIKQNQGSNVRRRGCNNTRQLHNRSWPNDPMAISYIQIKENNSLENILYTKGRDATLEKSCMLWLKQIIRSAHLWYWYEQ